jgi:rhomboid protease GluP
MDSQVAILLYVLLFVSILALLARARMPLDWTWAFGIQTFSMLACALVGLTVGPKVIFAIYGWTLFLLFMVWPRILINRFERSVNLLDGQRGLNCARLLRWFYWGKPGRLWMDTAQALAFYMQGEKEKADALLDTWKETKIPIAAAESLHGYRTMGHIICWDWQSILQDYQRYRDEKKPPPTRTILAASRAFAELGEIPKAAVCLLDAKLAESRLNFRALALTLLPFFCLAGAKEKVDKILNLLASGPAALPDYVRLYWWARVEMVCGNTSEAKSSFQRCLAMIGETAPAWQARIKQQLAELETRPASTVDWTNYADEIWKLFEKSIYVQEIVSPRRGSKAVTLVISLILVTYLLANCYKIFPIELTKTSRVGIFTYGILTPEQVLAGEYWRLFTYLFLHDNLLHLLLNVVGLHWFGRIAENIYGTTRFLFIYAVAGVLSGVAHTLLAPHTPAIGASGAIMGIFGAVAVGIFRLKDVIPEAIRRSELILMASLAATQIVLDQIVPNVAVFAHLGGLLAGIAIGMIVAIRPPKVRI